MGAFTESIAAFEPAYLKSLAKQIRASRHFQANNLNRDFIQTRGFSIVFRRSSRERVEREFPFFASYLERALLDDCDAFYLNPLSLESGSRVDPHIDRSLRAYCKTILPPLAVSVLYVDVPPAMRGGELVLARGRKQLARIRPVAGKLIRFDGDLTHSIDRMDGAGSRLSLVCEQYRTSPDELASIPEYAIESAKRAYD